LQLDFLEVVSEVLEVDGGRGLLQVHDLLHPDLGVFLIWNSFDVWAAVLLELEDVVCLVRV